MISKSNRPYLIRAIWEWCSDNGYTPYLAVLVDEHTKVPVEFVRNGEIVLNLSADATHRLTLGNQVIQFAARFSGVSRECSIPISAVRGIFARENGEGIFFQPSGADAQSTVQSAPAQQGQTTVAPTDVPPTEEPSTTKPTPPTPNGRKSHLSVVK